MKIETVPIASIKPHPKNVRLHPEANIKAIMRSLQDFGQQKPIVVDSQARVIAGCGTWESAKRLNWPRIDIVRTALQGAKADAYAIADNKTGDTSMFDFDLLQKQMASIQDSGLNLESTGFKKFEIEPLLRGELATKPIPPPALKDGKQFQEKWKVRTNEIWEIGRHLLVCGDVSSPAVQKVLMRPPAPILLVTDPPYGENYNPAWRAPFGLKSVGAVTADNQWDWSHVFSGLTIPVMYVWCSSLKIPLVSASIINIGYEFISLIIWAKQHFAMSRGDYHWMHEPCLYFVKKGEKHNWQGARDQTTVWAIKNANAFGGNAQKEEQYGHGTQKPLDCMLKPILNNSAKGQVVVDPFIGTGATMAAAHHAGRICRGADIDPNYCACTLERMFKLGLKVKRASQV